MPYTTTWFQDQALPLWEKHLLPIKDEIRTYLEVGVCEGASMRWVFENLEPEKAIGIDPYIPPRREQAAAVKTYRANMEQNLAPWLGGRLSMHYERSWDFFVNANGDRPKDGTVDLAYIDGSHQGGDCIADMVNVWEKLRRGSGIMVIDDYHRRYHRGRSLVRPAVEAFRLAFDGRWDVFFEARRQIAFRKLK